MTTTAFGEATIVEEIEIKQAGDGRSFATLVQLLELAAPRAGGTREKGDKARENELLVRFAYSTGGAARRGPVTLRRGDLERLRKALAKAPRLRAALGLLAC